MQWPIKWYRRFILILIALVLLLFGYAILRATFQFITATPPPATDVKEEEFFRVFTVLLAVSFGIWVLHRRVLKSRGIQVVEQFFPPLDAEYTAIALWIGIILLYLNPSFFQGLIGFWPSVVAMAAAFLSIAYLALYQKTAGIYTKYAMGLYTAGILGILGYIVGSDTFIQQFNGWNIETIPALLLVIYSLLQTALITLILFASLQKRVPIAQQAVVEFVNEEVPKTKTIAIGIAISTLIFFGLFFFNFEMTFSALLAITVSGNYINRNHAIPLVVS